MRLRSKILFGCLGSGVFAVFAFVSFLHFSSSASATLKHDLQIAAVPPSVANLQMGSDEWQDVMHCFHFRIAPADFPKLLAGRRFETVTFPFAFPMETMRIDPPRSLSGSTFYRWEDGPSRCEIHSNDTHNEVIIIYAVRIAGT